MQVVHRKKTVETNLLGIREGINRYAIRVVYYCYTYMHKVDNKTLCTALLSK